MEGDHRLGMRNARPRSIAEKIGEGDPLVTRYSSVDAFCGAGGLAFGLHRAGFTTVAAFDADEQAIRTFKHNVSERGFVARAEEVEGRQLIESSSRLDLLAGGPPCQGFSRQKRGAHLGDDRNKLVLEFARLVRETSPRFFLLENVDQLGQKRGVSFVDKLPKLLGEYILYPRFYNSADYGVPQTRNRYVIVGKHRSIGSAFSPPAATHSKWTTIGTTLRGLPEPPLDGSEHPRFPNHYRANVTAINIKRFSHVPQGGGWADIPYELRLKCHQRVDTSAGGWPDVYGRLRADGQAPTITGGFDSFTRGRYGHPFQDRPLTPREAARIQGFPDSFRFFGTRADVRAQIGNAVPIPLSHAIAESILRTLMAEDGLLDRSDQIDGYPQASFRFSMIRDAAI
jgi:DNA (cytosine-5)-methyltransferase 1